MPDPLWITYTWADNDEGDFDYLVNQLEDAGVPAIYDKIALVPGQRLWEQIAAQISTGRSGAGRISLLLRAWRVRRAVKS